MPEVSFRMDGRGKVHQYQKDSYFAAYQNKGRYVTMNVQDFAAWKNAGKRTFSNKVTDPNTGKNYAYHAGDFYEFDKTQVHNLGRPLKNNSWNMGFGTWKGENDAMKDRFAKGELIDRRRADRVAGPLEPMDVGTYAAPVAIGHSRFPVLPKAQGAWEANNDHIASGESIKRRNPHNAQQAYDEGLAIAIDNPRMHASKAASNFASFSPTYGSRQKEMDTEPDSTQRARIEGDVAHPARAFYRDALMQLHGAPGQDYSALHHVHQPKLNFTQKSSQFTLTGAYRYMFKSSGKFNQHLGAGRGFNPDDPGHEVQQLPNREFKYSQPNPAKTQGSMFVMRLTSLMKTLKLAK
ncbi:hypothetical protein DWU98_04630 [Dyella monticola]|uniref:Uncharacterized protein n=1 Tax=Dyella monticola TaxID=1927958 RepID=A0A370X5V4_9GAMM|nr:hypothetical protein [Dyella monticola]RDS83621.1 hypothetical protein DWU98_04630 [Dyella monticola]